MWLTKPYMESTWAHSEFLRVQNPGPTWKRGSVGHRHTTADGGLRQRRCRVDEIELDGQSAYQNFTFWAVAWLCSLRRWP